MTFIRSLHTDYVWPVLLAAAAILAVALAMGMLRKQEYGTLQKAASLALLICFDLQIAAGLLVYILQQRWLGGDVLRSYEHPLQMIVALALCHVGYRRIKAAQDSRRKYRNALIWMGLSVVIVILGLARVQAWGGS